MALFSQHQNPIRNPHGMTLTELLIASVLIGIVAIGAISMDIAVRQMREGSSRNAILAMRTSVVMMDIAKHAQQATGDLSAWGLADLSSAAESTLCMRFDDPTLPLPTPGDYADDVARCYTRFQPPLVDNNIHYCEFNNWALINDCLGADPVIGQATNFNFQLPDPGAGDLYLQVTITDCFRPDLTGDLACGAPSNPEYTLTSRISPAAHSF
ncbi:MAG: prepilin-type N-terminal cleavage/methylation domain-containing protein [Candidatus Omnitrophota bacterium]